MTAGNSSLAALKVAVKNRDTKQGLIFHSGRGVQYTGDEFKALLKENNIIQSMSRKANCWDNAVA